MASMRNDLSVGMHTLPRAATHKGAYSHILYSLHQIILNFLFSSLDGQSMCKLHVALHPVVAWRGGICPLWPAHDMTLWVVSHAVEVRVVRDALCWCVDVISVSGSGVSHAVRGGVAEVHVRVDVDVDVRHVYATACYLVKLTELLLEERF